LLQKSIADENSTEKLPITPFTKAEMLSFWYKYAQQLGAQGYKIMESLLRINEPQLNGDKITHELPNHGSKIEFESEINLLINYLRTNLNNSNLEIEIVVNESIEKKHTYTTMEKYEKLKNINPNIEQLKNNFELYF
jgi:hypothetical protein